MSAASLAGRTAVVTGAARGIGRATAEAFVREGMQVAIGDVDAGAARQTASELGKLAVGLPLDVRERESFAAFLDEAERLQGPPDLLVNNAGIMTIGAFVDEDAEATRRMIEVNAYGVLLGTRLVAPGMAARGGGHIVNVASTAGRLGFAGGATYCATKFFVVGLSEALHVELRRSRVRVSCILPGVVDTELVSGLKVPGFVHATPPEEVSEAILQAVRKNRFQTFVPRSIGIATWLTLLFPRRVVETAGRVVGTERALFEHDRDARRDYDERVRLPP